MGNKDQRRQQQQPTQQSQRGQSPAFQAVDEGAEFDTKEQTGEATGESGEGVQAQAEVPVPGTPAFAEAVLTEFDRRQAQAEADAQDSAASAPQEEVLNVQRAADGTLEVEVGIRPDSLQALANFPKTDSAVVQQAVAIGQSVIEQSVLMKSLIPTLQTYQEVMDPTKGVSVEQVRDQQLALFRLVRDVVRSDEDFGEGIQLLISAFGDPAMTSLKAPWIHRGFDDALVHLPVATQRLARSFFTLLDVAGSVQDPRTVYKLIDLSACLNREGLTEHMRHRLVSYFSA